MTEFDIQERLLARRVTGQQIRAKPANYKLCLQCLSIARVYHPYCLLCKCYRFSSDPVIMAATTLVSEKFYIPITAGYAPRGNFTVRPEDVPAPKPPEARSTWN